jgi:lipoprotein-releasing system permease protein
MAMVWQISIRYLWAHKRQSLICVAGVTISVMMFLAMISMMYGFRDKFIIETVESTGHVVVNDEPREAETPILEQAYPEQHSVLVLDRAKPRDQVKKIRNAHGLIAKIRGLPGVVAVAPEVTGDAIVTYGSRTVNVAVLGIEPEEQMRVTTIGAKLVDGDFERLRSTADGVVIGNGVALTLGARVDDSIVLTSGVGGRTIARVVGIFQTGVTPVDYSRVYMLMNNAQTLLDKKNVVNRLVLRTDDYTRAREYAAQIEEIAGYKTESWQETNANFLSIFAVQDVITYVITGALLVVAAFGVLNILVMSVLERVNDIAIMKSFGLNRRDITLIFLNQGFLIGVVGALAGTLFGKIFIELLRRIPIQMEGLVKAEGLLMSERPSFYILAFTASIVAVMIAAVYPARRAASADPVEVIRGAH